MFEGENSYAFFPVMYVYKYGNSWDLTLRIPRKVKCHYRVEQNKRGNKSKDLLSRLPSHCYQFTGEKEEKQLEDQELVNANYKERNSLQVSGMEPREKTRVRYDISTAL